MPLFALAFVAGTLLFHQLSVLPPWYAGVLPTLALAAMAWRLPRLRPLLGIPIAFTWAQLYAWGSVPARLPEAAPVLHVEVQGEVVSLVDRAGPTARFVFAAHRVAGLGAPLQGEWRLRLSWHEAPPMRPGETWQLPVRLRAAHGYASPGAWDYEGWLYWQGIRYVGYVEPGGAAQHSDGAGCCRLARVRAALVDRIDALPLSVFARAVLRALVIGDRSALDAGARELFALSGTSHLMAVSGLHIGLVAALGLVGVAALWRRVPRLAARVPATVAAAPVGLVLALLYASLAGMALPTQRAVVMFAVFVVALLARRESAGGRLLGLAAIAVLAWDPPSVVGAGFWLSFVAVALIFAVVAMAPPEPRWRTAVRVQLALSLGLWPIVALFGLPTTALAPMVNLVLVPLFGLLLIPFGLLGAALLPMAPTLALWVLRPVGTVLDLVEQALAIVTAWPGWTGVPAAATLPALIAFAVAVLLLAAPRGTPMRLALVPLLAVPWLPPRPELASGDFAVDVLDVGQGLAVVVTTRGHALLFDTGPEYPSGFSAAEAVVVPFLQRRRIARLDRLVLSHGDSDHAGGTDYLLRHVAVGLVQSGEPARVGLGAAACLAGEHWAWDGVRFSYLHPALGDARAGNNASCVLRVDGGGRGLLLTGDIEAPVERRLVAEGAPLQADIVVAPHHGSRSSSSAAMVEATRSDYAVFTAGWANRYGFPAAEVASRWREAGAVTLNTALTGTLRLQVSGVDGVVAVQAWRESARRFWWHDGGSAAPAHAVSSAD